MIITCEECATSFNLDEGLLRPTGSKVRCSKCKHIFFAYPPAPAQDLGKYQEESALNAADQGAQEAAAMQTATRDRLDAAEANLVDRYDLQEKTPPAEQEPDLSDLDRGPSFEDETEEAAGGGFSLETDADASQEADGGELDLSDLDGELSLEGESGETPAEEGGDEALSFDLDLEGDQAEPTAAEGEEELDLTGLDEELELEDEPEQAPAEEGGDEALSFDLDFEGDQAEPTAAEESAEEELDLSDIEKMLEEDDDAASTARKAVVDEEAIEAEEIDLSDLEKILDEDSDDEPTVADGEEPEELELDLDIDTGSDAWSPAESAGVKKEPDAEELDLSDLEPELEVEEAPGVEPAAQTADTEEDLELEFITEGLPDEELQLENVSEEKMDAAGYEGEITMTVEDEPTAKRGRVEAEDLQQKVEAKPELKKVKKPKRKAASFKPKRRARALPVLLLLLLLIGGVALLPTFGIQVPYVGDFVKPIPVSDYLRDIPYVGELVGAKVDEHGTLKMASFDLDSKFVENAKSGTLFLISGKVRNGYDQARGFVKVTGRLYSKGKKLVKVQTVYCGNTLTEKELTQVDMNTILKRLTQRPGQRQSNARILPGGHIPFMIVFSKLPSDLEEFEIQIDESLPAN